MVSELRQLADKTKVLLSQGGTTESGQRAGAIDDDELARAVATVLANEGIPSVDQPADPPAEDLRLMTARTTVRRARGALHKVDGGTSAANLADEEVAALELIVHAVGRPAMRFKNGRVQTPMNSIADNSRWRILVVTQRDTIDRLSSRVGKIAFEQGVGQAVLGTGWRVGPDLLITNRHVAAKFVSPSDGDPAVLKLDAGKAPFVDFAFTDETAGALCFRFKEAVFWDSKLDLALLRLDSGGRQLPSAIAIDWRKGALGRELAAQNDAPARFQGVEVYAVGHPYRNGTTPEMTAVFGDGQIDGRKRWAPGLVTGLDANRPVVRHDCSTLGGNSGSCLVSTEAVDHVAVGLHFGGDPDLRGPGFGSTNLAVSFAQITDHPAAQFLR